MYIARHLSYSKNNYKIHFKMSYTETTNDKIIAYLISEVILRKENNTIFTKEGMYYNDLGIYQIMKS